jgi:hypothetical protein
MLGGEEKNDQKNWFRASRIERVWGEAIEIEPETALKQEEVQRHQI